MYILISDDTRRLEATSTPKKDRTFVPWYTQVYKGEKCCAQGLESLQHCEANYQQVDCQACIYGVHLDQLHYTYLYTTKEIFLLQYVHAELQSMVCCRKYRLALVGVQYPQYPPSHRGTSYQVPRESDALSLE